jgi:copper chaperone
MNNVHYNVSDLMNSECKTQVKNALEKIKGVQKIHVSLPAGTIEVDYNEPADKDQIRNCIEKTGFTIT